jgi:hypothetical protein
MRSLVSTVLAVSFAATTVAWAGEPLSAGKPAGVQKAQAGSATTEWLVFGGIAALGAGILIATSGGRSSPANNQLGTSVVTTTGTAT